MTEFLALAGEIARSYATHHYPEIFADPWETDVEWFNYVLSGWWIIEFDPEDGWWLGVYSRCPAGQQIWDMSFPFCDLDAPLPRAAFDRVAA